MSDRNDHIERTPAEARQGSTRGRIHLLSIVFALAALLVVWLVYAFVLS